MYYALHIDIPEEATELLQAVLDLTGPLGLEVRDRTLMLPKTAPPLTPGQVQILAYYESEHEVHDAERQVRREFRDASIARAPVAEEDWSETWKRHVRAVRVGRIWVGPSWELPRSGDIPYKLTIEPGMAFGTGDHPTTILCLQALQDAMEQHPSASVLDVGTGSGVLAIAARKLGACRIVGTDIDPQAVRIACENAQRNGVKEIEFTDRPVERIAQVFDVVLANLHASVLCQLAPRLASRLSPQGQLLVSGVLSTQAAEVEDAFQRERLLPCGHHSSGEWVLLNYEKSL